MKILVSGSSGFIGSALIPSLTREGHAVSRLVRASPNHHQPAPSTGEEGVVQWNPDTGFHDPSVLDGFEAVVHLAGENISTGRWTAAKKARIRDSRVNGTRLLSEALASLSRPPEVFLCASAIGFYGNRGDEVLTEDSALGSGFLPEVCKDWESATQPAAARGVRVVNLRLGFVLSAMGGGLKAMLPPFRLGVGGVVGSGRQYISWCSMDDVVGAIRHALNTDALRGPVNLVTPHPITNRDFTKTLGRVLRRPTLFPLPAFTLRMAFGEMADEMLLASCRVRPVRLIETGYAFHYPELEAALSHVLGR